jgi:hypothetical protein
VRSGKVGVEFVYSEYIYLLQRNVLHSTVMQHLLEFTMLTDPTAPCHGRLDEENTVRITKVNSSVVLVGVLQFELANSMGVLMLTSAQHLLAVIESTCMPTGDH